jgi:putative transposase
MRSGLESLRANRLTGGMPRRNTENRRLPGGYHVYNRALGGQLAFRDDHDRRVFLSLLARFARMHERGVGVVAYCPMGTHFHLILWQKREGAIGPFMNSLITAYSKHFNTRHGTNGPLFARPYRARRLTTPKKFKWATVYVHDNHRTGIAHPFSSHTAFIDESQRPPWLAVGPALKVFGGARAYAEYVAAVAR